MKNRDSVTRLKVFSFTASKIFWKCSRFVLLFGISFMLLYPLIFMFVTAFRGQADLANPSVVWITRNYTLENFKILFSMVDYKTIIPYSIAISLSSAVIQTIVCALTGYGFARFNFKGKSLLFGLVLFTIIVPVQTYITPLFVTFKYFNLPFLGMLTNVLFGSSGINLIDSPWPFVIQGIFGMGFRSGLYIFIFRQFFRGMPKELEDAASIDGSSMLGTYLKVMLPNAIPALMTVFMFSLVWHWNDFYLASALSTSKQTVAVSLSSLSEMISRFMAESATGDMMLAQTVVQTGALIAIAPLLIVFIFIQKFFVQSIERVGIVG